MWIDISVSIENNMVHWPGDEPVDIHRTETITNGEGANVTAISMSAHTATHIDAPLHYLEHGKDITQISPDALIGTAKVVEIKDSERITLHEIKDILFHEGDRVLFKTRNSETDWATKEFMKDFVYLASDAAEYLASMRIACVGIDYLSIGPFEDGAGVHRRLLNSGVCIIEGLNLKDIEPGDYEMICLPIKIKNADGAPARVVIRKAV